MMNCREEDFTWLEGEKSTDVILPEPYHFRIVKMDGDYLFGTRDLNPNRLNIEVEKGVITKVKGLG